MPLFTELEFPAFGNWSPASVAATSGSHHSAAAAPMATDVFTFTVLFNFFFFTFAIQEEETLICKREDIVMKRDRKGRGFLIIGINKIFKKQSMFAFREK